AHVTGPDLRRISDPDLVSQVFDQLDEPLTVARGLQANQRRRRHLLIKHFGVAVGMHQLPFRAIPGLGVQPTHLLPAGMEITLYNNHRRLLSPQRLRPQTKTIWVRIEPSLLSNQSFAYFAKGGYDDGIQEGSVERTQVAPASSPPTLAKNVRMVPPCHIAY